MLTHGNSQPETTSNESIVDDTNAYFIGTAFVSQQDQDQNNLSSRDKLYSLIPMNHHPMTMTSFGTGLEVIIQDLLDYHPTSSNLSNEATGQSLQSVNTCMTEHSLRMEILEHSLTSLASTIKAMQNTNLSQIQETIKKAVEVALIKLRTTTANLTQLTSIQQSFLTQRVPSHTSNHQNTS